MMAHRIATPGRGRLSVDATSLVVGTTYISIGPAWPTDDGTAMVGGRCIPIIVKG